MSVFRLTVKKHYLQVIWVMNMEISGASGEISLYDYDDFGIFLNALGFLSCQVVGQKGQFSKKRLF